MDILDQSEIDALLAAASGGGAKSEASASTAAAPRPQTTHRRMTLPDEFRLRAEPQRLKRLLPVKVPVVVRLAERQANVEQILDWTVGTIIEFDKHADADLDLVVSNIPIASGNAVKCGEKFGLRVARVQPWTERLLSEGRLR